jgi:hypothetical protein
LSVYYGTTTNGSVLLDEKSGVKNDNGSYKAVNIGEATASNMLLYFYSDGSIVGAGLDLTVNIEDDLGVPTVVDENGDVTAILDGSAENEVAIQSDLQVDAVVVDRSLAGGLPATLIMPFEIDPDNAGGNQFFTFNKVSFNPQTGKWEAVMTQVEPGTTLPANTPCIIMPDGSGLNFTGKKTLKATTGTYEVNQDDWALVGTYAKKVWQDGEDDDYGFAAYDGVGTKGEKVNAGDFVHARKGAWINPMRAYLKKKVPNPWKSAGHRAAELPQSISVVLMKADGSTTEIGYVKNDGEVVIDKWYTLDGRMSKQKPAKKGLYIVNGKKVVVK